MRPLACIRGDTRTKAICWHPLDPRDLSFRPENNALRNNASLQEKSFSKRLFLLMTHSLEGRFMNFSTFYPIDISALYGNGLFVDVVKSIQLKSTDLDNTK